jgi:hypothetical protein
MVCGDHRGNKTFEYAVPGSKETLGVTISMHPATWEDFKGIVQQILRGVNDKLK